MSTPDFELAPVELPVQVPALDPGPVEMAIANSHQSFMSDATEYWREVEREEEESKKRALGTASALLNFIPIVGQVKGLIEAAVGHDLITGRELAWWEKALNIACIVPAVFEAKEILMATEEVGYTARLVKIGGQEVEAAHEAHGIGHTIKEGFEGVEAANKGIHAEHGIHAATGHHGGEHEGGSAGHEGEGKTH